MSFQHSLHGIVKYFDNRNYSLCCALSQLVSMIIYLKSVKSKLCRKSGDGNDYSSIRLSFGDITINDWAFFHSWIFVACKIACWKNSVLVHKVVERLFWRNICTRPSNTECVTLPGSKRGWMGRGILGAHATPPPIKIIIKIKSIVRFQIYNCYKLFKIIKTTELP